MVRIPQKLKIDPISEALLEIRFSSDEQPEVLVGRLASHTLWASSTSYRLPTADIPAPIRNQNPNLAVLPILELRPDIGGRVIKIGEHTLSYHVVKPYPGWSAFKPELKEVVKFLFSAAFRNFKISRLGFRYINSLTAIDHGVNAVADLNLRIEVAGSMIHSPVNLNYSCVHDQEHASMVRIASTEFIIKSDPGVPTTALVDIDIYTPDGVSISTEAAVNHWIELAHDSLKQEFFSLFTDKMYSDLVEKW